MCDRSFGFGISDHATRLSTCKTLKIVVNWFSSIQCTFRFLLALVPFLPEGSCRVFGLDLWWSGRLSRREQSSLLKLTIYQVIYFHLVCGRSSSSVPFWLVLFAFTCCDTPVRGGRSSSPAQKAAQLPAHGDAKREPCCSLPCPCRVQKQEEIPRNPWEEGCFS